jgi:GNAT superfamily N-acetyltransferase
LIRRECRCICSLPTTPATSFAEFEGLAKSGLDSIRLSSKSTFFEIDLLRALVHERKTGIDPGPFTQYQVTLHDGNVVIGGAGFFGPPDEFRAVELSFGIAPDYKGHAYGAEIVSGMVQIARNNGARFVIATARGRARRNDGLFRPGT